jgi:hypothetical protein
MKPQEMWDAVRAKVSDDPRWLTTPAGLVAGLALTRALVPGRKRGPVAYGLGGAAGAAAGFGAGTLWRAEAQAPAREQAQQQAQALGKKNPLEVLETHKPEEAAGAGRKALQLMHQDKGLDWFKGPLDPQELALARLATDQSDKQPPARGALTTAAFGTAGAAAPPALNWWRNRAAATAQTEGINKQLASDAADALKPPTPPAPPTPPPPSLTPPKMRLRGVPPPQPPPPTPPTPPPAPLTPQQISDALLKQRNVGRQALSKTFWRSLFPSAPGKFGGKLGPVRQMLFTGAAAAIPTLAGGGGLQLLDKKSLTQRFNETRAWKMRTAHLEALQKFQQAQLSPDQQQALQATLDYVRGQEHASRASWWKQWLYPTPGNEPAEWRKR